MAVGRAERRAARFASVASVFAPSVVETALDLLEVVELAWHDCYGDVTPPDDVVDDLLVVSEGRLDRLVAAGRLAVIDHRDLRLAADAIRDTPRLLEPDHLEVDRRHGSWDPLRPAEVAALMEGFPGPWWMIGGFAIEAFTGVGRHHEDTDICCFDHDVQALRRQLGATFHLWSNHGGTFRPLDDDHPEPLHPLSQIWMRIDADAPWRLDCILNPCTDDGHWRSRREEIDLAAPLEDVTWVADDGIRYLRPEYVLLFKAKLAREKDEVDLATTWPLLDDDRQAWLLDQLRRFHPDHRWVGMLAGDGFSS